MTELSPSGEGRSEQLGAHETASKLSAPNSHLSDDGDSPNSPHTIKAAAFDTTTSHSTSSRGIVFLFLVLLFAGTILIFPLLILSPMRGVSRVDVVRAYRSAMHDVEDDESESLATLARSSVPEDEESSPRREASGAATRPTNIVTGDSSESSSGSLLPQAGVSSEISETPPSSSSETSNQQAYKEKALMDFTRHHSEVLHGSLDYLGFLQQVLKTGFVGLVHSSTLVLAGIGLDLQPHKLGILGISTLLGSSVAAGISEYLSVRAEQDFLIRERNLENLEVLHEADDEKQEMVHLYRRKGLSKDDAKVVADTLSKYPEFWVQHMMFEELHIDTKKILPQGQQVQLARSIVMCLVYFGLGLLPLVGILVDLSQAHILVTYLASAFVAFFLVGLLLGAICGALNSVYLGFEYLTTGVLVTILTFFVAYILRRRQQQAVTHTNAVFSKHWTLVLGKDSIFLQSLVSLWLGLVLLTLSLNFVSPYYLEVMTISMGTCLCTGLGCVPFFFISSMSREMVARANLVAAGMMTAASWGLIVEADTYLRKIGPPEASFVGSLLHSGLTLLLMSEASATEALESLTTIAVSMRTSVFTPLRAVCAPLLATVDSFLPEHVARCISSAFTDERILLALLAGLVFIVLTDHFMDVEPTDLLMELRKNPAISSSCHTAQPNFAQNNNNYDDGTTASCSGNYTVTESEPCSKILETQHKASVSTPAFGSDVLEPLNLPEQSLGGAAPLQQSGTLSSTGSTGTAAYSPLNNRNSTNGTRKSMDSKRSPARARTLQEVNTGFSRQGSRVSRAVILKGSSHVRRSATALSSEALRPLGAASQQSMSSSFSGIVDAKGVVDNSIIAPASSQQIWGSCAENSRTVVEESPKIGGPAEGSLPQQTGVSGQQDAEPTESPIVVFRSRALVLFLAMFFHSFAEGVAIGVSFSEEADARVRGEDLASVLKDADNNNHTNADHTLGWFISLALGVHNIPEGLVIGITLCSAALIDHKEQNHHPSSADRLEEEHQQQAAHPMVATLLAILSSIPQPIMALAACVCVNFFTSLLPYGLCFAAGAMLYVSYAELWKEAREDLDVVQSWALLMISFGFMYWLQELIDGNVGPR